MPGAFKKFIVLMIIFSFLFSSFIPVHAENVEEKEQRQNIKELTSLKDLFFDLHMRLLMKIGSYPSVATCIIKNDSVVWEKYYGFRDIKHLKKPDSETIYGLGSVTKTFTATAYMHIFENGYCGLDDDVNMYLPFELRHAKYPEIPITIRDLLYHQSGINDYCVFSKEGMVDLLIYIAQYEDIGDFFQDILVPGGRLYDDKYWYKLEPGNTSKYSNIGYAVLGYMFQFITNQSLEDYCQEHIFVPLEMYNTSYHIINLRNSNVAVPYFKRLGMYIPLPYYDVKGFAGMCGIHTTLTDISHFLIMHMNNGKYKGVRILGNDTIALMHDTCYKGYIDPQSAELPPYLKKWKERYYGIGWWSTETWFDEGIEGHGGMIPGYVAFMMTNMSEKIGFIVLSNHMDIMEFQENFKFFLKTDVFMAIGKLLLKKAREL